MSWLKKATSGVTNKIVSSVNPTTLLSSLSSGAQISPTQIAEGIAVGGGAGLAVNSMRGAGTGATVNSGGDAGTSSANGVVSAMGGSGVNNALLGLGVGANIYGNYENAGAVEDANRRNIDLSREQMDFSANQADRQMRFQEDMSNSSYQRSVIDMRKAGINPILAAGGGASTPGGASGDYNTADMSPIPSVVSNSFNSAMNMVQTFANARNALASAQASEASVPNYMAKTAESIANAKRTGADTSAIELANKRSRLYNDMMGADSNGQKNIFNSFWGTVDTLFKDLHPWNSATGVFRNNGETK